MTSLLGPVEHVPVSAVTVHPRNARRGDVKAIAHSLAANGQFAPLIVQRSTSHILHGNHTYLAARDHLGWTGIDVVYVDVDDKQAVKILLAANRTSDLASYDDQLLAEMLREVDDLDAVGYAAEDLDDLENMLAAPVSLDDLASTYGEWEEPATPAAPPAAPGGPAPAAVPAVPVAPPLPGHNLAPAQADAGHQGAWPHIDIAVPPELLARFHQAFDTLDGAPHERLSVLLDTYEASRRPL